MPGVDAEGPACSSDGGACGGRIEGGRWLEKAGLGRRGFRDELVSGEGSISHKTQLIVRAPESVLFDTHHEAATTRVWKLVWQRYGRTKAGQEISI